MAEPNLSNFQCSNCGAKLLLKRRPEPKKRREEAFCPHCMVNLPPRDGKDTLQYTLVELPKHPKRPRDLNQWAKHMVDLATGSTKEHDPDAGKDAAATTQLKCGKTGR